MTANASSRRQIGSRIVESPDRSDTANRRAITHSEATRRTRAILTHPNRKPSRFSGRVSQGLTVDNVYRAKALRETSCIRRISSSLRHCHNLSPSSPISAYSLGDIADGS